MKIERTKNATRNIIFGVALKGYQIVIPFLMRTLMIYFMGVEYLGLNSLFVSVLQVLNMAELGVGSAIFYSMYKPIAEDDTDTICALMELYRKYYNIIFLVKERLSFFERVEENGKYCCHNILYFICTIFYIWNVFWNYRFIWI